VLQQHDGLLQLCSEIEFHGAIQQGRKLILNLYRGIWICCCATDEQKNADSVVSRSAFRMANEIDAGCRSSGEVGDLRKAVWYILGKDSNFELEQISRRKTSGVPGFNCASGIERNWTRRAYGTREEVPA
jgi:hypothetical protein